jgi:hypothetical protein
MYSGGTNPFEYHRKKIQRNLESERITRERSDFIDEMISEDPAPHLSDFKNKRDWATAKRIFLKSDAWQHIRKEVFKKHGKQCLKCGSFSRVEVDHIKAVYNFPALRLDLNNLQPLCHDCNSLKGTNSYDYRNGRSLPNTKTTDISYEALDGADSLTKSNDSTDEHNRELAEDAEYHSNLKRSLSIDAAQKLKVKDNMFEMLARMLPLSDHYLYIHRSRLNWTLLSQNENLPWSSEFIASHHDSWNWVELSSNRGLPWTSELIIQYEDYWYWARLSRNESLPWSTQLIDQYENRWDWGTPSDEDFAMVYRGLSENEALPWDQNLLDRYIDRWGWDALSSNSGISWTPEMLERYQDFLWVDINPVRRRAYPDILKNTTKLSKEDAFNIAGDPNIDWSLDMLDRFKSDWFYPALSYNHTLPWSIELIERYKNLWHWSSLSENSGLPWSVGLIEEYKELWDWSRLSKNSGLPWTAELIERYKNLWDWVELSNNKNLPWSIEFWDDFESIVLNMND